MGSVRERVLVLLLTLLARQACVCGGACVEVDSDTEVMFNKTFKLGCISCKMRGEVPARATVDWEFKALGEENFTLIYVYDPEDKSKDDDRVQDPRFYGRLAWSGSNKTVDLQDGSLLIVGTTYNDTGNYRCIFHRVLIYPKHEYPTETNKTFYLNVVPQQSQGMASILSEVMMYVSIIGLQLWLLVEMIYCYRKISAAGEEALRESAAEYLAIASESKENCAAGEQEAE